MGTKNRRIATYLPPEVDDQFKKFKDERGISGDSLGLITILSEFLGVTLPVSHQVGHDVFATRSELSEISSELQDLKSKVAELLSRSQSSLPPGAQSVSVPVEPVLVVPGQLSFLEHNSEDGAEAVAFAKEPDGKRWLSIPQAYEVARLRGYSQSLKAFGKLGLKSPGACLELYGLRKLPRKKGNSMAPSFEDVRYEQDLDCPEF